MGKLDPVKVKWIIKEKEKGSKNADIAQTMNITTRWVQMLYAQYKKTNTIPVLKKPGRPKKRISAKMTKIVLDAHKKYRCCAVHLEDILDLAGEKHIPHNTINTILRREGLVSELSKKNRKKSWVRYERTYSNSMWHTDWKRLDDGKYLICYQDDASRFIVGHGVFKNQTSRNAVSVLKKAIKRYGKPASILTDHGTQFYAIESEYRKRGATLFEKELVKLDIKHLLARVRHPQTNGKIERFYGEVQRKLKWFKDVDEMIQWYNNIRPHRSLDWDTLETPSQAFKRKMPEPGTIVIDEQTGEKYDVK
jgi:putative transposase